MGYVVTGGTGFIGRFLLERLLQREDRVRCVVRPASVGRLEEVGRRLGVEPGRLVPVPGDLTQPGLGVGPADLRALRREGVDHVFHLAAVYDLAADAEATRKANVDGTRHAVELANAVGAGCFHHVSSIAAAGRYPGTFREDMFDEAVDLDVPYFATKHEGEQVVRDERTGAYRVYRPGIVVGHSRTGAIDKADGPYYFFPLLKRLALLPGWLPVVGVDGALLNIVPVDFVADALDHIAHEDGWDGSTFHVTDPEARSLAKVLDAFTRAAGGPRVPVGVDARLLDVVPAPLRDGPASFPAREGAGRVLDQLGIPRSVLTFLGWRTVFDRANTDAALAGSGIEVPPLEDYADRLWSYWSRRLDPGRTRGRSLAKAVDGRRVLITGASSGIGREVALQVAASGGVPLLVSRSREPLEELRAEIAGDGGTAFVHTADLADVADIDRLVKEVLEEHGGVDVLVNNAGRSIRRSIAMSYDRFHDYERTMQLNYFGPVKLVLGLLPGMRERGRGHIVNVSSIGVQTNPPRFSAYVASKAALDAFSRVIASEVWDDGVRLTTVHMPLVRTPMIAPTGIYKAFPTISPSEAGAMVTSAISTRPKRKATTLGNVGEVLHAAVPTVVDRVLNLAYHAFPDSAAAKGGGPEPELSREARLLAQLLRGVHW